MNVDRLISILAVEAIVLIGILIFALLAFVVVALMNELKGEGK